MLTTTIHIDLDKDYILSELQTVDDGPFRVYHFEIINDETIKFVIDAGDQREAISMVLRRSDAVESLENVAETQLLITKQSSGALPIIRTHHGMLKQMSQFDGTHRVFDVDVFEREDLKTIVAGLRELGGVRVEQIRPFADPPSPSLSSRQSEVLELAYESGYFEWPRRTDVETLADELGVTHATVFEHLRKAEQTVIGKALGGASSMNESIPQSGDTR